MALKKKSHEMIPETHWELLSTVLASVATSTLKDYVATIFDNRDGKISEQQMSALNAITLEDLSVDNNPDNRAEFIATDGTQTIHFSNRTSTKGELRGSNLKKLFADLKDKHPDWSLADAINFAARNPRYSDLFKSISANIISNPSYTLDEKYHSAVNDFCFYAYYKIASGEELDAHELSALFDAYLPKHIAITSNFQKLMEHCNKPLEKSLDDINSFKKIITKAFGERLELTAIINDLEQWQKLLEDFSRMAISYTQLIEELKPLYESIKDFLDENKMGFSEALEQLKEYTKQLDASDWVTLWANCSKHYFQGKISVAEYKADSQAFYFDLLQNHPRASTIARPIANEIRSLRDEDKEPSKSSLFKTKTKREGEHKENKNPQTKKGRWFT